MNIISKMLKKISPFHNYPDTYLFKKYLKPYNINPYVFPYNLEFDGTTYWINQIDLTQGSNFHFKTIKDYRYFQKILSQKNMHLKNEFIEISENTSSEEILSILNEIQNYQVKVTLLLDQHKAFNVKEITHLNLTFKNLVILNFIDFYSKVGMKQVQELLNPLAKFGAKCGIGISIVGDNKDISYNILSSLSNTVESSGQSFYLNSKPFDNVFNKYSDIFQQLQNVQYIVHSSKLSIEDKRQHENSGLIDDGVHVFYNNPEYKYPSTPEEFNREFMLEMRHGTIGKYTYCYLLKKLTDFIIVHELHSQKLGFIYNEKLNKISRAMITEK